jgi:class 3 adenylate cyclase
MKPDIRITWNDGFALAYQIVGNARDDLVYLPGFVSNVDLQWDVPAYARFLNALASFSRLIVMDRRGSGCSDRLAPGTAPTLEELASDVLAVMEAAGSERATVFAVQEAAFFALLLAAAHPYRVERLILFSASPSWIRSDDLPDEYSVDRWDSDLRSWERMTSTSEGAERYLHGTAPALARDPESVRRFVSLLVNTIGIGSGIAEARHVFSTADLRAVLPAIGVPTLILRRASDPATPASSSRYLAEHIEGARYVELPGVEPQPWTGEQEPVLEEVERFVGAEVMERPPSRRLAAVLFTDIVDSTSLATSLGDAAWADVLAQHHATVRRELASHGGTEVDTAGDGFFATFDGPAQAVACAVAIRNAVEGIGLKIRAGVHAGEVSTIDRKPGGAAVVVGARIAAKGNASEVLVSQTVRDLVAGSGLTFEDAGEHELKGLSDRWHLYRVVA